MPRWTVPALLTARLVAEAGHGGLRAAAPVGVGDVAVQPDRPRADLGCDPLNGVAVEVGQCHRGATVASTRPVAAPMPPPPPVTR